MSGHDIAAWLVNTVIGFALIEGVLLICLHVLRGQGPGPADVVCNLAAGLCLLGALRSQIAGAGELACAAWLAAAGLSHALDTWRRWPRPSHPKQPRSPAVAPSTTLQLVKKRPT